MKYFDLLKEIKGNNKICVTGPQRSGTRIASQILSHDLNLTYVDEGGSGNDINFLYKIINDLDNFVFQCPCLSQFAEEFPKEITTVFMIRNVDDIISSQKRIKWPFEDRVKNWYIEKFSNLYNINTLLPISEIKYDIWNNYQKKLMRSNFFELEYDSLKDSLYWINKQYREKFADAQTVLEDPHRYISDIKKYW